MFGTPVAIAEDVVPVQIIEVKEPTVEEMIIEYATLKDVDPDLALRIARCESNFNPKAKNPNSSASGVYQWIKGSFEYYGKLYWKDDYYQKDRFNPKDNIELAIWVISTKGTSDWTESRHCWQ